MTDGPYDIGDGLVATATFDVAGVATDPTTVVAKVREPDGTVTLHTYNPGDITRVSAGVFKLIVVPDAAGAWVVHWVATGAVTAAVTQTYDVRPPAITGVGLASYTGDPATRPIDRVRLYVGDTVAPFDLTDNEIALFLSEADAEPLPAAVKAASALAIRFARLVDATEGDVSRSYSQRYKQFAETAKSLAADLATATASEAVPIPWAGGISWSENETNAGDGDLVPPYFYEGMDSRPGVVDPRRGC